MKIIIAAMMLVLPVMAFSENVKRSGLNENFVTAKQRGSSPPVGGTELEILKMVEMYTESVNRGDTDPKLIDALWEHSADVSNINIRGHQKGFEDIKDHFYAPIYAVLKDRNLRVDSGVKAPSFYVFEHTAVVEFYWKLSATLIDGNKPVEMAGRETHVYRKHGGQWKLIHLHYSGMPESGFRPSDSGSSAGQ